MISVVITTFHRAWALPYSLQSLVKQNVSPNEVIIVLKPSNDKSETIIDKFSKKLPIKLVIQKEGFVADAVALGLENASGDIILFMDDDAIADMNFIAHYKNFFDKVRDAGGATGLTFKAYLRNGNLIKTQQPFYKPDVARSVSYRAPLKIYEDYAGWISKSGLTTTTRMVSGDIVLSAALGGVNMGFRREAIVGCPLSKLYSKSKKGFNYESLLAYWARLKGFHTYKFVNPNSAPIVWHLVHEDSLTRKKTLKDEFWLSYDVFKNYFRYKKLGADVSFLGWIEASIAILRKQIPARILALLYTLLNAQK